MFLSKTQGFNLRRNTTQHCPISFVRTWPYGISSSSVHLQICSVRTLDSGEWFPSQNASLLLFSLLWKIPNTNNSRKGMFRLSSLRMLFIMAGKAWLQKLEASAHITPTITQETGGGCSAWIAFLLLFKPLTPAYRMVPPTFRVAFPLLSYPNEEIPSQPCLEVCFHGDS